MADHDIPALVARETLKLSEYRRIYREVQSAVGNNCDGDVPDIYRYRVRIEKLERALSRLSREVAERDAQLSAARGEALFWQEAEAQRTRERDEARAALAALAR